jgi:hypothetical protein
MWHKLAAVTRPAFPQCFGSIILSPLSCRATKLRCNNRTAAGQCFLPTITITYEHARKLVKGIAFPSRLVLKEICRVLTLNFDEMDRLLVEDKLRHKYGPRYAEALGENPRYEEVKYDIDALSPENWTLIKNMIKTARRTQFHH